MMNSHVGAGWTQAPPHGPIGKARGIMSRVMDGCGSEGLNSFAVVAYLPEPLAGFVDALRQELVPACRLRAHITVLPPRPPACEPELAWDELRLAFQGVAPFPLELSEVGLFPVSQAIYISIGSGRQELEDLHTKLNHGRLKFSEPWTYHPHITLAQQLEPAEVNAALDLARKRWREFTGPRRFTVDHLTFVQNTGENRWKDLADRELRPPVLA
jgi:2'-5' RNA ligase